MFSLNERLRIAWIDVFRSDFAHKNLLYSAQLKASHRYIMCKFIVETNLIIEWERKKCVARNCVTFTVCLQTPDQTLTVNRRARCFLLSRCEYIFNAFVFIWREEEIKKRNFLQPLVNIKASKRLTAIWRADTADTEISVHNGYETYPPVEHQKSLVWVNIDTKRSFFFWCSLSYVKFSLSQPCGGANDLM